MAQLTGTYQITGWAETPYNENEDGSKQSLAKITCRYTGDIEGLSKVQYLMAYGREGNAKFSGFETITCTIGSKQGELVLQHNGKFENGVASSEFVVLSSSNSADLEQIAGSGTYCSGENGQANYHLEVSD